MRVEDWRDRLSVYSEETRFPLYKRSKVPRAARVTKRKHGRKFRKAGSLSD